MTILVGRRGNRRDHDATQRAGPEHGREQRQILGDQHHHVAGHHAACLQVAQCGDSAATEFGIAHTLVLGTGVDVGHATRALAAFQQGFSEGEAAVERRQNGMRKGQRGHVAWPVRRCAAWSPPVVFVCIAATVMVRVTGSR